MIDLLCVAIQSIDFVSNQQGVFAPRLNAGADAFAVGFPRHHRVLLSAHVVSDNASHIALTQETKVGDTVLAPGYYGKPNVLAGTPLQSWLLLGMCSGRPGDDRPA